MPRAFSTKRCHYGFFFVSTQLQKIADFGTGIAPLFPVAHPYSATEPLVQSGNRSVVFGDPVVVEPAPHIFSQLSVAVFHGNAPASSCQEAYPPLEFKESFVTPSNFASYKDKTKVTALTHRNHLAAHPFVRPEGAPYQ